MATQSWISLGSPSTAESSQRRHPQNNPTKHAMKNEINKKKKKEQNLEERKIYVNSLFEPWQHLLMNLLMFTAENLPTTWTIWQRWFSTSGKVPNRLNAFNPWYSRFVQVKYEWILCFFEQNSMLNAEWSLHVLSWLVSFSEQFVTIKMFQISCISRLFVLHISNKRTNGKIIIIIKKNQI